MSQNINLDDYKNPTEEVLNDNTVAPTENIENDVDSLKKRIDEMGSNKDVEKLKEEFKDLFGKFPTIFNKVVEGTIEMGRLKFMLKMIKDIENKKISKHQASIVVGKELVDNIVKPQMNK
jgi:transcription-repair coupling factor (superfamily II helicase)|uniref:Uncharacterized protein n=1 Tax=viral metagenome TaxID=1070528 RepID=A0A6C0J8W7_9ZZZZ